MATKTIITLSTKQIKELYRLLGGDDEDTNICIGEDKETGESHFAWFEEYPEEGCFNL